MEFRSPLHVGRELLSFRICLFLRDLENCPQRRVGHTPSHRDPWESSHERQKHHSVRFSKRSLLVSPASSPPLHSRSAQYSCRGASPPFQTSPPASLQHLLPRYGKRGPLNFYNNCGRASNPPHQLLEANDNEPPQTCRLSLNTRTRLCTSTMPRTNRRSSSSSSSWKKAPMNRSWTPCAGS